MILQKEKLFKFRTAPNNNKMGRVRTRQIKKLGKKFVTDYNSKLSKDFTKNKETIDSLADIASKRLRNKIAGYISKLKKTREE